MMDRSLIRLNVVALTFVTISIALLSCKRPTPFETPKAEILNPVPAFRFEDLGPANKKDFETAFPSTIREVFNKASELHISTGKAGEEIIVTEPSERQMVLDALYWDLANSYPRDPPGTGVACKELGPIISTAYLDDNLLEWKYFIRPSYFCGWFDVSAQGKNHSTLFRSKNFISNKVISGLFGKHLGSTVIRK